MSDLLNELRTKPEFIAVLKDSLKHRPVIPAFVISETQEQQYMVVERIKQHTMMRNGFDLLYVYLVGKKPE